jgi:glycosyltransferase involved in cell wall biosynthesis
MAPRVSVCIPTHNGAAFLAETLTSAVAQTYGDFEVVVVDDCSTDESFEIAERFARSDPRVRAIRNAERAGSGAANAKVYLAHARGEWIKTLNQDDLMAPTCLARMLDASARGPLVICCHDHVFETDVDPDVRASYEQGATLASELPGDYAGADAVCLAVLRRPLANFIGPTSVGLIHRDCFTKYGSFDPAFSFMPDLDFWTRVGTREGIAIAAETLVTFRVHNASISAAIRRDPRRAFRRDLQQLRRRLKFARAPGFENIRRVAAALSPAVDLEGQLRTFAFEMRWGAIETRYRARDPWPLAQWDAFVDSEPDMQDVLREIDAALPFSARVRQFIKRRL